MVLLTLTFTSLQQLIFCCWQPRAGRNLLSSLATVTDFICLSEKPSWEETQHRSSALRSCWHHVMLSGINGLTQILHFSRQCAAGKRNYKLCGLFTGCSCPICCPSPAACCELHLFCFGRQCTALALPSSPALLCHLLSLTLCLFISFHPFHHLRL